MSAASVQLWLARTAVLEDCEALVYCKSLVSAAEREKSEAEPTLERARESLLSAAMRRAVLSVELGVHPRTLQFSNGPWGKPHLHNSGERTSVEFNTSHSRGLVALAVSHGVPVGVDVEFIRRRDYLAVADGFFAPDERESLVRAGPERALDLFFSIWTHKEAYLKARGIGISIPLDSFSFLPRRGEQMSLVPPTGDAGCYQLYAERIPPSHRLALVAMCAGPAPEVSRNWWSLPLHVLTERQTR